MVHGNGAQTIADQVDNDLTAARLRILIVGAGIAGATLGALLRQRGEPAAIIERDGPKSEAGFMLGMLPLGGRVLNGLELRQAYIDNSVAVAGYSMHGRNGQLLRTLEADDIVDRFGLYNGLERGALLDMLRAKAGGIIYEATIESIGKPTRSDRTGTTVRFSDGSRTEVDLVVAADGIHSPTRALVVSEPEIQHFDSGWGGFVGWCETLPGEQGRYRELWGTGHFVGLYPVPGRSGVFFAGPANDVKSCDPFEYADQLRANGLPEPFASTLETIDHTDRPVYWPMADIRSKVWWRNNVVLLGDAAAAFLPTAGVGASAAMDAASALSDELSRADRSHLDFALTLFERRQRRRTELAQRNSRWLSKLMFEDSAFTTRVRDLIAPFYPARLAVNDISRVMEGR